MNLKTLLFVSANLLIAGNLMAQSITVIDGGQANAGLLEATINGDTAADGSRVDPNRIYELKAGEFYIEHGPIIVDNPDRYNHNQGSEGRAKTCHRQDARERNCHWTK